MFSSREVLDIAIRLEENGERLYREALAYVTDQSLRDTLVWLAEQEQQHRNRFMEMKDSSKVGSDSSLAEQVGVGILREAVDRHAFSLEEVNFESIRDEKELMKSAIEFEQDVLIFYEIIRSFITEPDALKNMDEIIKEEQKHVAFFLERRKAMENESVRNGR
jgi:rubrerythrin